MICREAGLLTASNKPLQIGPSRAQGFWIRGKPADFQSQPLTALCPLLQIIPLSKTTPFTRQPR